MSQIKFKKKEKLDSKASEAFKTLRTNILFCGSSVKVLCLTSSTPNEGKTSVSVQLAASFAEAGKKVLFVDADIRRSVLVGRYKVQGELLGLTHYMTGQNDLESIIYTTEQEGLDIIFPGPVAPNPTELLGGEEFRRMIEIQREHYDYIVIDAPPLGSVIDAAIIAENADGAILVVESCAISYKLAQNVKRQLEKSECRILGVVLNKVDMEKNGYYGSYYGKYYGKHYGTHYGKYENGYDE